MTDRIVVTPENPISITDLVKRVSDRLPPPTCDLPEEQRKYDALYMTMDPGTALSREHCHELEAICAFGVQTWPRRLFRPVLCAGGGAGVGMRILRGWGFEAVSCDISQTVRRYYEDEPELFTVCALHEMPYRRDQFGLTLCCDVLEHVPESNLRSSVRELARVTRDMMLLSVSRSPSHGITDQHVTLWEFDRWESLFQDFGDIRTRVVGRERALYAVEIRR